MLVASRNIQCQEQGCSFVAARRQVIMQHYRGLMTTNRLHQVPAPGPSDTAKHALIYLQKAAAVRVATLVTTLVATLVTTPERDKGIFFRTADF